MPSISRNNWKNALSIFCILWRRNKVTSFADFVTLNSFPVLLKWHTWFWWTEFNYKYHIWLIGLVTIKLASDVFFLGLAIADTEGWRPTLVQLAGRRRVRQLRDVSEDAREGIVVGPPVEQVLPRAASADSRVRPRSHDPEVVVVVLGIVEPRPRPPVLFVGGREFVEDHSSGDVVGTVRSVRQVLPVVEVVLVVFGTSEGIVACKNYYRLKTSFGTG